MTIRDCHKDGVRLCYTKFKSGNLDKAFDLPATVSTQSGQSISVPQRLRYSMMHLSLITGRKEHGKKNQLTI